MQAYLECGQLQFGFTRRSCESCKKEHLLPFSCKKRGFCPSCCSRKAAENVIHLCDNILPHRPYRQWCISFPVALRYALASNRSLQKAVHRCVIKHISRFYKKHYKAGRAFTGSITFIQRFGSALNLNPHFHILFLDGLYTKNQKRELIFKRIPTISDADICAVLSAIRDSMVTILRKRGLISQSGELTYCEEDLEPDPYEASRKASTLQLIALGERSGMPVRRLGRGLGYEGRGARRKSYLCASLDGLSLHAATRIRAHDRKGLEKLVSYMARGPISPNRLTRRDDGLLQYKLKTPFKDGTHSIILSEWELMEKIAALIPPPWLNMTRYSGVFAPACPLRGDIILNPDIAKQPSCDPSHPKHHIPWKVLLKRCFNLDMDVCGECGGKMRTISVINDPFVISKILKHIGYEVDPPSEEAGPRYLQFSD